MISITQTCSNKWTLYSKDKKSILKNQVWQAFKSLTFSTREIRAINNIHTLQDLLLECFLQSAMWSKKAILVATAFIIIDYFLLVDTLIRYVM